MSTMRECTGYDNFCVGVLYRPRDAHVGTVSECVGVVFNWFFRARSCFSLESRLKSIESSNGTIFKIRYSLKLSIFNSYSEIVA